MEVSNDDIARLSPLIWRHLDFLGRYDFSLPEPLSTADSGRSGTLVPHRTFEYPYATFLFRSAARAISRVYWRAPQFCWRLPKVGDSFGHANLRTDFLRSSGDVGVCETPGPSWAAGLGANAALSPQPPEAVWRRPGTLRKYIRL